MNTLYLFSILFALIFCNPEKQSNNANCVMMGIPSDPYSIDPLFSTDLSSKKLNQFLFERLFENKKGIFLKSRLIKKHTWKKKNGAWSLNFELNEIKFSTGEILTSKDVIFSLNRLRTENSPRRSDYTFILKFYKDSDKKFSILVDKKNRKIFELLSNSFSSIYQASSYGKEQIFISTGPYSLKNWNRNDEIQLTRNVFDLKKNLPQSIVLKVIPQSSTGIFLFKKNILDTLKIPYFLVGEFQRSGASIVKNKGSSIQYIAINNSNFCFDKNFRKALNYSIDKSLIVTKLLENHADLVYASLPPKYYSGLYRESKKLSYEYNLQQAITLLKKSKCYPEVTKRYFEFRMRGDDENRAIGLSIQKNLNDLGIHTKILPMEKIQLYKENGEGKGDLTLLSWFLDSDSILNYLDPLFSSLNFGNSGNRGFYNNQKIQTTILKARDGKSLSQKELRDSFDTIEEDAPWIFLWSMDENYILSEKAKNFTLLKEFL
ncbi:MAG: ABC transporter substrate-binding protein [Leptospiraceae bacterium]|nr:ABC transporter substrate-binding protein [Leptospiraceae bacterium]MCK6380454.1 ABC transporter substrate-binding protein [Leptospiraceae bacterium]NUM41508.1 ABC transporter substrate-binding protein [Leptospiraceae bacterium]